MFKTILGFVFWIAFSPLLSAQGGSFVKVQYHKQYVVDDKTYPVELVYTQNDGFIKLRIMFDHQNWSKEKALGFLRSEVLELVQGGRTEIGEGYFFTFIGKYPEWVPHRQYDSRIRSFQYLQFTQGGKVVGKEITGIGLENLVGGLDPYSLKK